MNPPQDCRIYIMQIKFLVVVVWFQGKGVTLEGYVGFQTKRGGWSTSTQHKIGVDYARTPSSGVISCHVLSSKSEMSVNVSQ